MLCPLRYTQMEVEMPRISNYHINLQFDFGNLLQLSTFDCYQPVYSSHNFPTHLPLFGGFRKWGYLQIIHDKIVHDKPSIYPPFMETPICHHFCFIIFLLSTWMLRPPVQGPEPPKLCWNSIQCLWRTGVDLRDLPSKLGIEREQKIVE